MTSHNTNSINKSLRGEGCWVIIVVVCLYFALFVGALLHDSVFGSVIFSMFSPLFTFVLQSVMTKKQENRNYNIELLMSDSTEKSIVWKNASDNATENVSYLEIVNTGQLSVYEIFLKVTKNDNSHIWLEITENLKTDTSVVIKVPYKRETIKEVTITCDLQTECRTKRYSGYQSCGQDDKYIFSKIDRFDEEKYSIMYEDECKGFESLERFWM